jgi:hypothetical protein
VKEDILHFGFIGFSLGLFLYIAVHLHKMSRNPECTFELRDLVMSDGKASKSGVILMGAFLLTSLYFMFAVLHDKMTESLFLAYAGVWVVPTLTKMVKG